MSIFNFFGHKMESLILESEKLHKNNEKPPPRFVIYTITDKLCVSFFLCVEIIKKIILCFGTNCWFSHDVTKTIDPTEILLSLCIRAGEN